MDRLPSVSGLASNLKKLIEKVVVTGHEDPRLDRSFRGFEAILQSLVDNELLEPQDQKNMNGHVFSDKIDNS